MKKLTSDKGKSVALDIAKQEFQAYKNALTAKPTAKAAATPPGDVPASSSPQHFLWCFKRPGSRSRLIVELSPTEIKVTGAVMAANAPFSNDAASRSERPTLTRALTTGSAYAGCPHCGARGFIYCNGCRTLLCMGTRPAVFSCPLCGTSGTPKTGINVHFEEQNPPGFVASEAPRQLGSPSSPVPLLDLKRNRGS